ncbi:formyl transferase [Pisolithus thermaeus]|nr:formyl transferase [Pisolithus croceorrhizus]KAI6154326.1 formyl transferase [Pisolithus thermaeus]
MEETPLSSRRLAVLISGPGTNLQALIDAQNTPVLPNTSMVLVLSNRKVACGLARATTASPPIPTAYLACQPYTREDYDLELARIVLWAKPDLSFLEVLRGSPRIDDEGQGPESGLHRSYPQINIHLALPGRFGGANAIQRALGVMVHRVVAEVDMGEPLIVREVPIEKGESIKMYEERLHRVEWEIILQATKKVPDKVRPLLPESMDLA